ncbi:hypothetical protein pb186bvf_003733 [Paramecium bursaria]
MKHLFCIILIEVALSINYGILTQNKNRCQCSEIDNQASCTSTCYDVYCQSLGCLWTGGQCTSLSCSQATNSSVCNIKSNCIWNYTNNACTSFTTCSQVQVVDLSFAIQKDAMIHQTLQSTPLLTQGTCQGLSQTQCGNYEQNNIQCVWYNNQCARGDCTMFGSQADCNAANADPYFRICTWASNSCRPSVCTDLNQTTCSQIIELSNFSTSNCIWYNGTCFAPTQAQLSSNLCSLTSGFTYVYKNSTGLCTKCQGYSYGEKLLTSILIILSVI